LRLFGIFDFLKTIVISMETISEYIPSLSPISAVYIYYVVSLSN
jgi:hypothetical protein